MIGKLDKSPQLDIFRVPLKHRIRQDHDLVNLAGRIKWDRIVAGLEINYSPNKGRKAIPVRKMAALLILKHLYECSDNSILKLWQQDPTIQYFCGEVYFREKPLINRFEMVSFRHRIGDKGKEIIFYPELLQYLGKMQKKNEKGIYPDHSNWHVISFFRHLFFPKRAAGNA